MTRRRPIPTPDFERGWAFLISAAEPLRKLIEADKRQKARRRKATRRG